MLTNKLVNPTHKDVSFPYNRGIYINIPADSQVDLSVDQMDDFRPGKPGSEEARIQLEYHGLFLLDGDRSYDEQALTSLKSTFKNKKSQLDGFVDRIRAQGTASGAPVTPDLIDEQKNKSGYAVMEEDLGIIDKRIKYLEGVLNAKGYKGKVKETLDPKTTCFITSPPRTFPSEHALEMFLLEKPDSFKKEHYALQKQMLGGDK